MSERELTVWQQQIVKAKPKMESIIDPKKVKEEIGFASQMLENNEKLRNCTPSSIMNACINIARTGITINPVMKLAYLVPRSNQCVLDFSYIGLVKMLKDYGAVKDIKAYIVYEDEEFHEDIENNKIYHVRKYAETEHENKSRKIKGAYTRSILLDGTVIYGEFMLYWEILKVEKVSPASSSKYSPWQTWRESMIKKTVIKRDFKFLIAGNMDEKLKEVLKVEDENSIPSNQPSTERKNFSDVFGEEIDAEDISDEDSNAESNVENKTIPVIDKKGSGKKSKEEKSAQSEMKMD